MNGMHDVGGMGGFGPVVVEKNEPVFHYPWEGKVFAMNIAMGGWRKWNLDQTRSSGEKFSPRQYLAMSYYERWVTALADRGIRAGLFTAEEVKAGHAALGSPKLTPPIRPEMVPALVRAPRNYVRRFTPSRCTRSAIQSAPSPTALKAIRACRATLAGAPALSFSITARPSSPTPMQTATKTHSISTPRELWGEQGDPRDSVTLDLYEPYFHHV
jgi:nitrile hydratase subunit beta